MWIKFIIFLMILFLVCLMMIVWSTFVNLSEYSFVRLKSSTFECGFEVKDKSRQPFSLRFFLMMMVFLMFDMELCLLLKLPIIVNWSFMSSRVFYVSMMVMLIVGVLEEWRRGLLVWR